MKAATLFSGIGAPEQACPHWDWLWHSENGAFPSAVMKHHHPQSINLGDINGERFCERALEIGRPDVVVFGSPCQSFSIAGRRLGMDDPRGNLALVALGVLNRLKPGWFAFENVPGLLSASEGRDFGLFLRAVDELGYSCAWTVLDAQYFGLAQRRERVFVIGSLGDWRGPASVLFEPESLCGNSPPRRAPGERATGPIAGCANGGGANGPGRDVDSVDTLLACHDLSPSIGASGRGFERAGDTRGQDPVVAWALQERDGKGPDSSTKDGHLIVADPIQANEPGAYSTAGNNPRPRNLVMSFTASDQSNGFAWESEINPTLNAQMPNDTSNLQTGVRIDSQVRRLTPRECERLQGFPDDFTLINYRGKPAADGPRYKALGNSMAVPVMQWILNRIANVQSK